MNVALPYRILVYANEGKTWIEMLRPKPMLDLLSDRAEFRAMAEEVGVTIGKIIDDSK